MNQYSTDGLDSSAWKILGVVILAPLMSQMDSTIVNVSLSSIRQDLHASISSVQWIISGYLLALALMLPIHGWLVDRLGTKKLYVACFTAFTLASFLCGSAHTIQQLIFARVLQGMAGGLLAPLTQLMMARIGGRQMAKVIGYASAPVLLAPLFGPILAGVILKYAGWPWLFYVNLPVGIVAAILAIFIIPNDDALPARRPLDLLGFITISPGLACLLYGFEEVIHRNGTSFLLLGFTLVAVFIWHASRHKASALIDLELFRIRVFSTATMTQFLANGISYAGQFIIPLYLITGCGLTSTQAGWMLAPIGIGMLCVYPFMGFLTDKAGCRAVASSGVFLNLLGTLPFLWMTHGQFSTTLALLSLFLRGLGQGAISIPSIAAAYASVPTEKLSYATTAMNISQRLGGPIATTALAIVTSLSTSQPGKWLPTAGPHPYFIPFLALIVFQLLVLGSAIRLPLRIPEMESVKIA